MTHTTLTTARKAADQLRRRTGEPAAVVIHATPWRKLYIPCALWAAREVWGGSPVAYTTEP